MEDDQHQLAHTALSETSHRYGNQEIQNHHFRLLILVLSGSIVFYANHNSYLFSVTLALLRAGSLTRFHIGESDCLLSPETRESYQASIDLLARSKGLEVAAARRGIIQEIVAKLEARSRATRKEKGKGSRQRHEARDGTEVKNSAMRRGSVMKANNNTMRGRRTSRRRDLHQNETVS